MPFLEWNETKRNSEIRFCFFSQIIDCYTGTWKMSAAVCWRLTFIFFLLLFFMYWFFIAASFAMFDDQEVQFVEQFWMCRDHVFYISTLSCTCVGFLLADLVCFSFSRWSNGANTWTCVVSRQVIPWRDEALRDSSGQSASIVSTRVDIIVYNIALWLPRTLQRLFLSPNKQAHKVNPEHIKVLGSLRALWSLTSRDRSIKTKISLQLTLACCSFCLVTFNNHWLLSSRLGILISTVREILF